MAKRRVALGFQVRTGKAIVVALAGPADSAEVLAKTRIDVATTFDEGAVFHVGQTMAVAAAQAFVRASEARFVACARDALAAFVAGLDATIVAAGMAAGPPKSLPPLEKILTAHPLVHAAEGELYRRVFADAAGALGFAPARVPPDTLARRAGNALALTPAKLTARLKAMGKASGRPWAADQKQAALVAWVTLAELG